MCETSIFNFKTKQSVNPLENIEYFYTNPYMADNHKLLSLVEKLKHLETNGGSICTTNAPSGHVVTLFPIEMLVEGNCVIKWRDMESFVINNSIYCRIMDDKIIRVDTVRF